MAAPIILLPLSLALFLAAVFALVITHYRAVDDPLLAVFSLLLPPFYTVLYFWRRLRLRLHLDHEHVAGLRRGLWLIAVFLGVLLSAVCVYGIARVVPLPWAVAPCLLVLLALYCFYRLLVLHLDMEGGEEAAAAQGSGGARNRKRRPPI